MNLSKEYILMCDEAIEIQKHWKPKVGDYVWRKYSMFGELIDEQIWGKDKMSEIIILTFKSDVVGWYHATNEKGESRTFTNRKDLYKATCIWIPRQDQLQEMIEIRDKGYDDYYDRPTISRYWQFQYWFEKRATNQYLNTIHNSMEQLWLAFVMDKIYNKTWDSKTQKWKKPTN